MRRKRITASIAAGAAGLAAALALTIAPAANAYTPDELPGLGYAVSVLALGNNCHEWTATGYGASRNLGSDCEPGFQEALDAFVTETCPCAQPPATTATTEAVTAPVTTTDAATTASPPETTAAPETPVEAPLAPATPVPASPTPTCDVQCQIDSLQAQIDALRGQLAKLIGILAEMPGLDPLIRDALMSV